MSIPKFIEDKISILITTSAVGCGIDNPNIKTVIDLLFFRVSSNDGTSRSRKCEYRM